MAKTMRVKRDFSCGGLVWDETEQKVLLVQVENLSGTRVWTFPKGHPEGHETDEEAAIREVTEETGYRCEIMNPLMDVQYSYVHKGIKHNKTVRWFSMRPLEKVGESNPGEILDCKWYDINTVKKVIKYDTDRKLLKRLSLLV